MQTVQTVCIREAAKILIMSGVSPRSIDAISDDDVVKCVEASVSCDYSGYVYDNSPSSSLMPGLRWWCIVPVTDGDMSTHPGLFHVTSVLVSDV